MWLVYLSDANTATWQYVAVGGYARNAEYRRGMRKTLPGIAQYLCKIK